MVLPEAGARMAGRRFARRWGRLKNQLVVLEPVLFGKGFLLGSRLSNVAEKAVLSMVCPKSP